MSIATLIEPGLGSFGNIATFITEGFASYTGLPQPNITGYSYVTCTTTSFIGNSEQTGSVPPVVVGDVFITQLVSSPGNYTNTVNTDGTGETFVAGDSSRQSFLYEIFRIASNSIDGPATIWINEVAPIWSGPVFLKNALVGTPITPIDLTAFASSPSGDVLTFTLASGALPPGITQVANILSGTPTGVGVVAYNFTFNATDNANQTTMSFVNQIIVTSVNPPPPVFVTNVMPDLVGLELLLQEAIDLLTQLNILVPASIGYFGQYPIKVVWQQATTMRGYVTAQSIAAGTVNVPANTPITLTVNDYAPGVAWP